ncbi:MAG TPA: TOBE domain-containing protein [Paenalcaligenes sp.]|nr:TOBE domain-containing protein [Paenalcaligenes sp.]
MSDSLPPIELAGSIWFHSGTTNWGNPRRMALLASIHEHGSIAAAARHINLSYKAAWDAVHTINSLASEPLIICATGGTRGGGAWLSPKAQEILALYQHMHQLHEQFIEHLAQIEPGNTDTLTLLQKMLVQTSARNTFMGTIQAIQQDALYALLTLDIGLSAPVYAAITQDSRHNLGLLTKQETLVFIKATAVQLTPEKPHAEPAKSIFKGRVLKTQGSENHQQFLLALDEHKELTVLLPHTDVAQWPQPWPEFLWVTIDAKHVLIGRSGLQ